MVEDEDVKVTIEWGGFNRLVLAWSESGVEDFSAPKLGSATMPPHLIHNRQPKCASDIMNY